MTCTLHVAWDDRLAGYDFGPAHPMAPVRLKLTMELDPASPCPLTTWPLRHLLPLQPL